MRVVPRIYHIRPGIYCIFRGVFFVPQTDKKEVVHMEFLTGVKEKDTMELNSLLRTCAGENVKVNGAVHTIRKMGTVAFIILRKREGLLQGVYEEGTAQLIMRKGLARTILS